MLLGPALAISAVLFAIGTAGVLLRRNAIVIFMCVELMLNAVNLAFVAFAERLGVSGQIFVFFVMAVASAGPAAGRVQLLGLDRGRYAARELRAPSRSAVGRDDVGRDGRGVVDPHLQRRLHARGRGVRPLLRLPQSLRLLHADAGAGREL